MCQGYPKEFQIYLDYCRALRFDDCPDYEYLRGLFASLMKRKVGKVNVNGVMSMMTVMTVMTAWCVYGAMTVFMISFTISLISVVYTE